MIEPENLSPGTQRTRIMKTQARVLLFILDLNWFCVDIHHILLDLIPLISDLLGDERI
jgi:hypothetical protein